MKIKPKVVIRKSANGSYMVIDVADSYIPGDLLPATQSTDGHHLLLEDARKDASGRHGGIDLVTVLDES